MRPSLTALALLALGCRVAPTDRGDGGDAGPLACGLSPDGGADPCLTAGLACTPDYTNTSPTGAYCEPPGEFFNCLTYVGCATADLACAGADAGVPGTCLAPCTTTADCWDPLTSCGLLETGGPTYCLINGCFDFWGPCNSSTVDGGDGTCVYAYTDPVDGPFGVCLQGGTVAHGAACNYFRGPSAALCVPGQVCVINGEAENSGACLDACDALADGGPSCGGFCVGNEPPAPPPPLSALDLSTQAGGCTQTCPDGNCGAPLTCYEVDNSLQLCLP